jgi:hypothetical protein
MAVTRKKRNAKLRTPRTARRKPRQTEKRADAWAKKPVVKRGELKAAVARIEKHLASLEEEPGFLQRIDRSAEESGRPHMSLREINREIKAARAELRLKRK